MALKIKHSNSVTKPIEDSGFSEIFENLMPGKSIAILRPNQVFIPPTDIYENASHFIVKLEIAGTSPDKIIIEWIGYDLIIRGTRKESTTKKPTHYHQVEIHYGAFERVIHLSHKVNLQGAKAAYNDGFLVITIPKSSGSRTRLIPIENQ